ncbi:MAG: M14 family zinc carboxypeptidase [Chitinophagaceae bacterium]
MKRSTFTLSLFFLFCLAVSTTEAQEKYSKVKIYAPSDIFQRKELIGLLQIDHFINDADGGIISEISAGDISRLKKTGYKFDILVDDVTKKFMEESRQFFDYANRFGVPPESIQPNLVGFEKSCTSLASVISTPSLFSTNGLPPGGMGGFYTFAEMVTKMDQLVTLYPTLVQKINLGTSIEGRIIWALKISDNVSIDENEPEVLYTALQHAREAIGGTSMIFLMQYLCENYATNTQVQDLVNNRELFIVPCVNPDGYEYNRSIAPAGGGNHRKNRRNNNGSNPGVDLNRNYSVDWSNCAGAGTSCGSGLNTDDTYYGTAAFSEPETQAIRNFATTRNFVASIDQHCFGPYYSLPFGRPSLHSMSALDVKYYTYVPSLMGKYNGMRAGNSPQSVGYEVAGGIKDWLLMGDIGTGTKGKIYGMTGEGGGGGFWAPSSQIIALCKGMTFQNIQLALTAGSYFDVQDMNDIAISSLTGSFNFKLLRVGLQNAPVTVSLIRVENVMAVGAPVVVNSMPNYFDLYNGSISYTLYPSLATGQRVKFVWKVVSGGITTYDSVTKIYNPLTLFSDDMETGLVGAKWTVTGGFNYGTLQAFAGTKSLSESPTVNYTTSSTRTAQTITNLDLTGATAAYASFWVRHRAENFRDKLRMQVSTNGTTWVSLCGKNTVQENNDDGSTLNSLPALTGIREEWFQELVDLTPYTGQAALRFRFEFTSDSDPSSFAFELDEGFSIDNFKVIKTTATLLNRLPVKFENVKGKLINTETIRIDWEAFTDAQHDYFELEKSIDGNNFKAIGRINGTPPYYQLDKNPAVGNNYYRVKQTDKDGKYIYSRVINIINNPRVKLTIYPNPVSEVLRIKVDENRSSTLTVNVMDMQGRIVHNQTYSDLSSTGTISVNTASWIAQVYQLKITNSRGELITIQKFSKQ